MCFGGWNALEVESRVPLVRHAHKVVPRVAIHVPARHVVQGLPVDRCSHQQLVCGVLGAGCERVVVLLQGRDEDAQQDALRCVAVGV